MPAMNAGAPWPRFLFVALFCQVLISGTSIECWLRRDLPRRQRVDLAGPVAGQAALCPAPRLRAGTGGTHTGLYDFRQAGKTMHFAGLLAAFPCIASRQQAEQFFQTLSRS